MVCVFATILENEVRLFCYGQNDTFDSGYKYAPSTLKGQLINLFLEDLFA